MRSCWTSVPAWSLCCRTTRSWRPSCWRWAWCARWRRTSPPSAPPRTSTSCPCWCCAPCCGHQWPHTAVWSLRSPQPHYCRIGMIAILLVPSPTLCIAVAVIVVALCKVPPQLFHLLSSMHSRICPATPLPLVRCFTSDPASPLRCTMPAHLEEEGVRVCLRTACWDI